MRHSFPFLVLGALLLFVAPARADIVYTLAPSSFHGPLGTSQAYTASGYTIETYGFNSALSNSNQTLTLGTSTDLFAKFSGVGSGETGLGIKNDPTGDDEITTTSTVKLDLSSIPFSPITFSIGSMQNGEGFAIFGGASNPTNFLGSVTGNSNAQSIYTFGVTAAQDSANGGVFYVTAISDNVLLDSVNVAAVPEPTSITLALTGLGTLAGFGWLRLRKKA
jgi:PEP-CTERM motif